jgi:hypothetical protein
MHQKRPPVVLGRDHLRRGSPTSANRGRLELRSGPRALAPIEGHWTTHLEREGRATFAGWCLEDYLAGNPYKVHSYPTPGFSAVNISVHPGCGVDCWPELTSVRVSPLSREMTSTPPNRLSQLSGRFRVYACVEPTSQLVFRSAPEVSTYRPEITLATETLRGSFIARNLA